MNIWLKVSSLLRSARSASARAASARSRSVMS